MPANTTTAISRDDLGSLLDYTERYAESNSEPADGHCLEVIRRAHAWLETGSSTIDLVTLRADLIDYVQRFSELNDEPADGDCRALLARLSGAPIEATTLSTALGPARLPVPRMNADVRDAILFALWHHQGGTSQIGQPIRRMLRMGVDERLTDEQVVGARRVQAALSSPATVDAIASINGAFDRLNSILDAAGSLEAEATQRAVCEMRLQIALAQGDPERTLRAQELLAELDKETAGKTVRFVVDADRASGGYVAFSVNEISLEKIRLLAGLAAIRETKKWRSVRADGGPERLPCSGGGMNLSVEWGSDSVPAAAGVPMRERDSPCDIYGAPDGDVYIGSAALNGWPRPSETVPRKSAVVNIFTELQTGFEESEDGEVVFLTDNREVHELYARDHAPKREQQRESKRVRFVLAANEEAGGYVTFSLDDSGLQAMRDSVRKARFVGASQLQQFDIPVAWGAEQLGESDRACMMLAHKEGYVSLRDRTGVIIRESWMATAESVTSRFNAADAGDLVFLSEPQGLRERYFQDHSSDEADGDASSCVERQRG